MKFIILLDMISLRTGSGFFKLCVSGGSWHWLLMLDTCQYEDGNHVNGRLKPETLKWLEVHLQVAQEHGIQVLPIGHHNLLWGKPPVYG